MIFLFNNFSDLDRWNSSKCKVLLLQSLTQRKNKFFRKLKLVWKGYLKTISCSANL